MDTEVNRLGERIGEGQDPQKCQSRPSQGPAFSKILGAAADQVVVGRRGDADANHGVRAPRLEGAGDRTDEPSRDQGSTGDSYQRRGGARMTRPALNPVVLPAVPSLDDLADDPVKAAALPLEAATALFMRASTVQSALLGRLVTGAQPQSRAAEKDEAVDVKEAAKALGKSVDWMYRHADTLPFTVHVGRSVRFSRLGVQRWLRIRQGRR